MEKRVLHGWKNMFDYWLSIIKNNKIQPEY